MRRVEAASKTGVIAEFDRQLVEQGIADRDLVRQVRDALAARLPESSATVAPDEAGRFAVAVLEELATLPADDAVGRDELAQLRAQWRALRDEAEDEARLADVSGRELLRHLLRPGRGGNRG